MCEVKDCNKLFKRLDHLTRHKQNHYKNAYPCTWAGCSKLFVRKDVLAKHVERHYVRHQRQQAKNGLELEIIELYPRKKDEDSFSRGSVDNFGSGALTPAGNYTLARTLSFPDDKGEVSINFVVNGHPEKPEATPRVQKSTSTSAEAEPKPAQTFPEEPPNYPTQTQSFVETPGLLEPVSDVLLDPVPPSIAPEDFRGSYEGLDFDYDATDDINAELIYWMLNDNAHYPDISQRFIDYLPPLSYKDILNATPTFVFLATQSVILEETRAKMVALVPQIASNEYFTAPSIEEYLETYWSIYHVQYPILHRPTFSTLDAHPLLLLSMAAMGAALDSRHQKDLETGAGIRKLAQDIAEPLRYLIFTASEFLAPMLPWVIQLLLILECYETTCSNRRLHLRAHLHQGFKIQLLRRSPLLGGDPLRLLADLSGGDVWKNWIEIELLKRCAFMAFFLDTLHAIIFGHETILFAHQIKLLLPCAEELWEMDDLDKAKLPPQIETPKFLAVLTKLLRREPCELGPFSRRIILAGLLTVMFQMEQRDIQIKELKWRAVKSSWKETILLAIDVWKDDLCHGTCCDASVAFFLPFDALPVHAFRPTDTTCKLCVYHISQAFLRLKQYDCIIYAGAPIRMNVRADPHDYEIVKKRVHRWATSEHGRILVVHAYLMIAEILLLKDEGGSPTLLPYDPNLDPVFYRPNIVASLLFVIWNYNFCLYGCEANIYSNGPDENSLVMSITHTCLPEKVNGYKYISSIRGAFDAAISGAGALTSGKQVERFASILDHIPDKHCTVGLLRLFKDKYENSDLQLCREYAKLMENCIQRSLGRQKVVCENMYEDA